MNIVILIKLPKLELFILFDTSSDIVKYVNVIGLK